MHDNCTYVPADAQRIEPIWKGALSLFLALCVVDGMVSAMMRRLENDPNPEESVPDTSNLHTDL